jgi:hypothetical protein
MRPNMAMKRPVFILFACHVAFSRPAGDQRGAAAALPLGHGQGEAHFDCTEPAHLSPDLTIDGFYSDSKSSVIDPGKWKAYAESSAPYKKLGEAAIGLEDSPV